MLSQALGRLWQEDKVKTTVDHTGLVSNTATTPKEKPQGVPQGEPFGLGLLCRHFLLCSLITGQWAVTQAEGATSAELALGVLGKSL